MLTIFKNSEIFQMFQFVIFSQGFRVMKHYQKGRQKTQGIQSFEMRNGFVVLNHRMAKVSTPIEY